MKIPDHDNPEHAVVVETWRLVVGTSLFLINVRADGSWQPAYIAPRRLGGWTIQTLPDMPAAEDVEAAVRTWAQPYGSDPRIRRLAVPRSRASTSRPTS
ncbi:hypothetical protein [Burkholderia ambifaria]|uniref:hypothetical protein n=1 Tax=Burkholderia ambifaria TaxID=152480 RepID=UPI00158BA0CC|nr:hypothetical protein [Burkholderia ambifaria]